MTQSSNECACADQSLGICNVPRQIGTEIRRHGFQPQTRCQRQFASNLKTGLITDFNDVVAVPEPSSWAIAIFGLVGIGFLAYRRKPKFSPAAA